MVHTAGKAQPASCVDAGSHAQPLPSRAERDAFAGVGRRSADDGLHYLAADWATGGGVGIRRKPFELRSKNGRRHPVCHKVRSHYLEILNITPTPLQQPVPPVIVVPKSVPALSIARPPFGFAPSPVPPAKSCSTIRLPEGASRNAALDEVP